jgi:hypothetical protein
MRFVPIAVSFCALSIALTLVPPRAWGLDDKVLDPSAIAALEVKAAQAEPKEQCYLYAELVHQMTELAGRQYTAGKPGDASATLKVVQRYAEKIRNNVAADSRKLKDAEMLMQRTSFRLKDILESRSYDERPALDATLKDLDQVQNQLMMEVFKK